MADGVVIIGSGPGGLEAARAYREHGGTDAVTLVSHDEFPPYARPPLSKELLRGDIGPDELDLEDAAFYDEHDIALLLGVEAVGIDVAGRTVTLGDGRTLSYEACVLATGSRPKPPDVPGIDGALLLRSRAHAADLAARAGSARSAVVVGSGFIGCEAAASLAMRGLQVTMATSESAPHRDRLGDDVARRVHGWLSDLGVEIAAERKLASVSRIPLAAVLDDGVELQADLVLVVAGVAPRSELAARAGLDVQQDRIVVDSAMRTSAVGVWAAGDVVLAHNDVAGRSLTVEHWGEAERMGEVAGTNLAGGVATWAQVPGFWSQIGEHTLKYAAWGDGFDRSRLVDHGDGGFTAWYGRDDTVVGVLTHERDADYDRGSELVEQRAAWDEVVPGA